MPQEPPKLVKAVLKSLVASKKLEVPVHFNPTSLVYSVENSTSQQSGKPDRKQYAAQFTGKLTMDLVFDTTSTGEDVRNTTRKVAWFMKASADARVPSDASEKKSDKKTPQAQPVLSFEWGAYVFKGTMESFRETIDFFSADGIPLRAAVSISLAQQDKVLDEGESFSGKTTTDGRVVPSGNGDSALAAATRGGDPGATRQLASDNGLESLRFTGGADLQVSSGVQLKAAAGFSAGASGGADAGAGLSGGLQVSAGGSGGGALFGAKASAGVSASQGAFAGLETGRATTSTTLRLDPTRMLPSTIGADVAVHAGASFSLGGSANVEAGAGFTADVGAKFSFRDRLTFDSDD